MFDVMKSINRDVICPCSLQRDTERARCNEGTGWLHKLKSQIKRLGIYSTLNYVKERKLKPNSLELPSDFHH